MVLAIAAPRQVLSRHFHNVFEVLDYMHMADRQRRQHWNTLQDKVWNAMPQQDFKNALLKRLENTDTTRLDPAVGPIDAETMRLLHQTISPPLLDRRDTLLPLALSVGVYSSLPPVVGRMLIPVSPTYWMRRQLLYWADGVANDDQQLLEERDTLNQLSRMELTEACFRRALPTQGVDDEELRRSLEQHLEMVSHLPADFEHKGLWSLVCNILRQSCPMARQIE
jgi:LETM1-like protein